MTGYIGKSLAATLILTALSGQALGQNALGNGSEMNNRVLGDRARNGLGDGRGLDTNTQVGSMGRNDQVRDFQAEMRFRNSIVTGNAPNGLSFRGDIPYYAPQDFRGTTGSNDLYSFRRDSLYSGLAGMGIRGTEALQQQFALQTGNRLPELLTGSLTVNRFGAGDPNFSTKVKNSLAPMGLAPNGDPDMIGRTTPSLEPDFTGLTLGDTQELGTLRSTSAYTSTRGSQPTLLDIRTTPNQDLIGVSASGLRGIQSIPLGKSSAENNIAAARNNFAAGSVAQQNGARANVPAPAGVNPIASPKPLTEAAAGSAAYTDLMSRLSAYAGQSDPAKADVRPEWQKQLDAIRLELANSDLGQGPKPVIDENPQAPLPSQGAPGFTPSAIQPVPPVPNFRFDPATVATLRNASGQINSLVPLTETAASAYSDHMQVGQSELSKGRFFDAEEAFTRAVAVRPDDAMALVGRIHAQLGAGMNLSAWMNLRELFKNYPELLGAKYGPALLPDAERLAEINETLVKLIDRGGVLHREAAMLLSYVGYQTGDTKALDRGLVAMESAKEGQADALTDLMYAVWSGKEPAPEPGSVVVPAEPVPSQPPSAVESIK